MLMSQNCFSQASYHDDMYTLECHYSSYFFLGRCSYF